jgi:hypothetical protein
VTLLALAVLLTLALGWVGLRDRRDRDMAGSADSAVSGGSREPVFSGGPLVESPAASDKRPSAVPEPPVSAPATTILREWDRGRARAYARGDVAALRASYTKGSLAGTSDAALLRDYQRRSLRVERLRMQLLAVEVLARDPVRLRLRVTDRVHGAVAVGPGSHIELPRDRASTRVVTMRRVSASADWKVAAVAGP